MFVDVKAAIKEIECYGYCLSEAARHFEEENYKFAALYLENAARSLKELERLKEEKPHGQVLLIGHIVNGRNDVGGGL